jgi:DNA (cytosine-5)-methyltransferase 1
VSAFYNEPDPCAAEWLRNLIAAGHIAHGIVDERDIRDIAPDELAQFTQCHFFAGIGVHSLALRAAGWPDDRPIWTGSCPCQPFSAAGRGAGFTDERHLWPHWHWLIKQCQPPVVAGEQVASKDGLAWLDLVSADMEGEGYTFRAVDLCAAGIGLEWEESQAGEWLRRAIRNCGDSRIERMLGDFAEWAGGNLAGDGGKHIRQRLYFVGMADSELPGRWSGDNRAAVDDGQARGRLEGSDRTGERRDTIGLADSHLHGCDQVGQHFTAQRDDGFVGNSATLGLDDDDARSQGYTRHGGEALGQRGGSQRSATEAGLSGGVDHTTESRLDGAIKGTESNTRDEARLRLSSERCGQGSILERTHAPLLGWNATDWLYCRDDKWRAVEPGTFPLAHGVTARVGKLRAFGNALDARTATAFYEAFAAAIADQLSRAAMARMVSR